MSTYETKRNKIQRIKYIRCLKDFFYFIIRLLLSNNPIYEGYRNISKYLKHAKTIRLRFSLYFDKLIKQLLNKKMISSTKQQKNSN